MDLEYLAFVVTILSFVEKTGANIARRVYAVPRRWVPSFCEAFVAPVESYASLFHARVRTWLCEKGTKWLVAADDVVDDAFLWMGNFLTREGMSDRFKAVRNLWSAAAARVSEAWSRHGLLLGTLVVIVALLQVLCMLLAQVLEWPSVKALKEALYKSAPASKMRYLYSSKFLPMMTKTTDAVKETVQVASKRLAGPLECIKERISICIDRIVASVTYRKTYEATTTCFEKLQSTPLYKTTADRFGPYVAPTIEKICQSPMYIDMVDRLTPIKEE